VPIPIPMLDWGRTKSGSESVAHRHAKIGVRIALVLGIALGGAIALPTYLLVTYQTRLERSAARAAFVLASSDLGRQAQVHFKIQVQEWKNVLLRGADPQLLEKYRGGFEKEEAAVQKHLTVLRARLTAEALDVARVDGLLAVHRSLGERYRAALAGFEGDAAGARKVDHAVRGIDRAPTEAMDALVADLKKLAERYQADAIADNAAIRRFAITLIVLVVIPVAAIATWFCRDVSRRLRRMVDAVRDVAEGEGDLTRRVDVTTRDEIGEAAAWMNRFIEKVHDIIAHARTMAAGSALATGQLSSAAEHLAAGSHEQAAGLEEAAASIEQIAATIRQNSDNARQAADCAVDSTRTAEKGREVIDESVAAMNGISQAAGKISQIIGVIDEIAFQTNLLALNAAVEAARAGEQGRGFAVVAAEVRNLAQRSASAAKEIKALILESVDRVERGAVLVERSGRTLDDIVTSVRRVSDIVADIAAASEDQRRGIDQVNQVVVQMDATVQNNAEQTEELSTTTQALATQARVLEELVGRFRVAGATAAPVVAAAARPSRPRPKSRKPAFRPITREVAVVGVGSQER